MLRADLKLSKGKLCVQAAHASIGSYKKADGKIRNEWENHGSKKVAVKVEALKDLMGIYDRAKRARLPCSLIKDAGRTEVPPGTITAVGIGPESEENIDAVTGELKML